MKRLLVALMCMPWCIIGKVLLITHSYNRPEFIEIHASTFKAFLQDDYEYVVFNDASEEKMKEEIEDTCKRLGIRCFAIPQELHTGPLAQYAGYRHMVGLKYSLQTLGFDHKGIVSFVDSDMFLIKPFSIEKYLEGYDISGELQGRKNEQIEVRYLSPVLTFMNMNTLPNRKTLNFDGGYVEGLACDVGAQTYHYLKNNPGINPRYFGVIHMGVWKVGIACQACTNMSCESCSKVIQDRFDSSVVRFIQNCPDDIEFYLDDTFLHYRSGSNWNNKSQEYHAAKMAALNNLLTDILYTH